MSDLLRFDSRKSPLRQNLLTRARLLAALRLWFSERGFVEVETPILCSSPGVETQLQALETTVMGRPMYLTTSPEFHMKRLVAVGFERIFQVTRAFRDGERGSMHNPEFTIVEWYRAGADYRAIIEDCEQLVYDLAQALHGMPFLPEVPGVRNGITLSVPFCRKTFKELYAEAGFEQGLQLPPDERLRIFVDHIEPALHRYGALIVYDFPHDMRSLARLKKEDPTVAERFELFLGGIEVANGFTEVSEADEFLAVCMQYLAERRSLGLKEYPVDKHYLTMLDKGLPPCAGVALGFDRLVMALCGARTISEVIAFPVEEA